MRLIFSWAILLVVLAIGAAGGAVAYHSWQLWHALPVVSIDNLPALTKVTALGRIEPAAGIIAIGAPVPDRLLKFMDGITEGAQVSKGQPLAELASRAERQLEYDLVTLQIREAADKKKQVEIEGNQKIELDELRKKQLIVMGPLEVKLQEAKIGFLERQVETAKKNRDRLQELPGTVSQQERDQQELALSQAKAELAAGKDTREQLVQGGKLKQEIAQAQIEAARAELARSLLEIPIDSLKQQKAVAQRRLEQTLITAPSKGEILKLLARPGETVGAQPILQLADTSHMVVIAEIYETDIDKIKVGQHALIWSRVWPDPKLPGTVTHKGHIIARNRIFDTDPTANVDRRVLEVTIDLKDPGPLAHLIHHQVYVEIALNSADTSP
jgi:HlyD family secretion protein